jgi:hypothetical protein
MELPWFVGLAVAALFWMFQRDQPAPETPRRFGGGAVG